MTRKWLTVGVVAVVLMAWSEVSAVVIKDSPRVEIWTDRGEGSVYREGERVDIYIRPDDDCYVIVYGIDTDGYLRVLYPYDCYDDGYVSGGRIYRIGRDGYRRYYVNGPQGVEYIHVVASVSPFRRLYWHGCHGYDAYAHDVSWSGFHDYWGCALPPRIYGDPYIAMQTIDEFICLDALDAGLVWVDFTYFYVHDRVRYPRYLCYDCHGFDTYIRPYVSVCTGFSIAFVDCDPYYRPWSWWWWCSPRRTYCGPRYVCHSKKVCKSYPSQYKWKTRDECRTDGYVSDRQAVKIKHGNIVDGVQVKSRQRTGDLDLYSRREPRGTVKYKETGARNIEKTPRTAPAEVERSRTTETRQIRHKQTEAPKAEKAPVDIRKPDTKRKSSESKATQVLKSLRKALSSQQGSTANKQLKSASGSKRSSESSKKKVAPKVRTKNQGRSPATRRRVSR
jgi:hypothetical protein